MKKLIYNLLFVMSVMIVSFVGISRAEAAEYSSMSCSYGWSEGTSQNKRTVNIKMEYTNQGEIKIPKEINWVRTYTDPTVKPSDYNYNYDSMPKRTETITYEIVNVNFNTSSFVKGKHLQPVCPGTNDVDFYMDEDSKKIYIATSQSALESYLDKKNVDYSGLKKAKLSSQKISNGNKIVIDGKTYDTEKTFGCDYIDSEHDDWTLHIEIGKETGNLLAASAKAYGKSVFVTTVDGTFSSKNCPRRMGVSENNNKISGKITDSVYKVNIYRDSSKGAHTFRISDASREQSAQNSASDFEISDVEGCSIWGSLLVLLRDDVFGVIKAVLVGLLILLGMLDFAKSALSGEDNTIKKAFSNLVKRIIIVVIIFLLPLVIETTLSWVLPDEEIESCITDF